MGNSKSFPIEENFAIGETYKESKEELKLALSKAQFGEERKDTILLWIPVEKSGDIPVVVLSTTTKKEMQNCIIPKIQNCFGTYYHGSFVRKAEIKNWEVKRDGSRLHFDLKWADVFFFPCFSRAL